MKERYTKKQLENYGYQYKTIFENRGSVPKGYVSMSIKKLMDNEADAHNVVAFYKRKKEYYPLFTLDNFIETIESDEIPLGYRRIEKYERAKPDLLWYRKGFCFPIEDVRKAVEEKACIYDGEDTFDLQGLFTEKMVKKFNIPFEETTIVGYIKTTYINVPLYKVPAPYDKVLVIYDHYKVRDGSVPNYCFSKKDIKWYHLTPIGEKEVPECLYHWFHLNNSENETTSFFTYYNRKDEGKYRLRFLMDPEFNPHEWEKQKRDGR